MGSSVSTHKKRPVTHLMIWVGSVLPESRKVEKKKKIKIQYKVHNKEDNTSKSDEYAFVNYVETLKGECKKMADKDEACILVYDSKMITKEETAKFQDIVKDIPNCYLVDYEDFVLTLDPNQSYDEPQTVRRFAPAEYLEKDLKVPERTQGEFIKDIEKSIQENIETHIFSSTLYRHSIGNLVDCMRMLLLLHPYKLKLLARKSDDKKDSSLLEPLDFSLLYQDFDMIQTTKEAGYGDLIDDEKTSLMFCKDKNGFLENGLILVNSIGDRNADIENIILHYINNFIPIYKCALKLFNGNEEKVKDFDSWFKDENHCSWKINDKKVQEQQSEEQHENSQQLDITKEEAKHSIEEYINNNNNIVPKNKSLVDCIKKLQMDDEGKEFLRNCHCNTAYSEKAKREHQVFLTYDKILKNNPEDVKELVSINDVKNWNTCECSCCQIF